MGGMRQLGVRRQRGMLELALTPHDVLVLTQQLTLDGEHAIWEPKRLR
jgi:hypothetical protein